MHFVCVLLSFAAASIDTGCAGYIGDPDARKVFFMATRGTRGVAKITDILDLPARGLVHTSGGPIQPTPHYKR